MFLRMPFGLKNSPAWLQGSLEHIIHEYGPVRCATFFDDITPFGTCQETAWEATKQTIARLAQAGYMINLTKCEFLTTKAKLLGHKVWSGKYQLGPKCLANLFSTAIPTTLKEL